MNSCLVGGAMSSLVALLGFLVVHHFWVRPIWSIAPAGIPMALVGGVAIGWSFFHLSASLPAAPWTFAGLFALMLVILAPSIALSYTHGPLFDLETATIPAGQGGRVAIRFVLELLVTATLSGAIVGWVLGRTPVAALSTALAGLAYALGPGHNIPMFGTNPVSYKGHAIVLIISLVVAVSLPALVTRFEHTTWP